MRGLVATDTELMEAQKRTQKYHSREGKHRLYMLGDRLMDPGRRSQARYPPKEEAAPSEPLFSRDESGDRHIYRPKGRTVETSPLTKSPSKQYQPTQSPLTSATNEKSYTLGSIGGSASLRVKPSMTVIYPPEAQRETERREKVASL